jgi:L-alanine-DL-glutamate epimerase-like enolase superfamily enzyme
MTGPYEGLVRDMNGGVGWRDLGTEKGFRRAPEREAAITGIEHVVVEGNFPWNLIVVRTDTGYGIGEAFVGPVSEYVEYLEPGLVGESPLDVDRLVEHMTQLVSGLGGTSGYAQAAVSGIEAALWDVTGKIVDLPVYQLLGGKYRDRVRVYADCHAGHAIEELSDSSDRALEDYDPDAYAAAASEAIDDGFDALKFDLDAPDPTADTATRRLSNDAIEHVDRVAGAIREEIGTDPLLAFDLHWNFTVESAARVAQALEPYDVAWLEDPVPPEGAETHRRVRERTTTPILTGENVVRVEGTLPYLTEDAVDVLAPDVQKCGGLAEFRKVATLADAYSVPVAPHNVASPIGTVASVHACASVPNAFVLEYHARDVEWWDDLLVREAPLIEDGAIAVPEAPGLGVEVDADVLADHIAPGESVPEPL